MPETFRRQRHCRKVLTTAAGLVVAIPTLLFYNFFVHRIEGFITDVERISSDIVEKMIEEGQGEG